MPESGSHKCGRGPPTLGELQLEGEMGSLKLEQPENNPSSHLRVLVSALRLLN